MTGKQLEEVVRIQAKQEIKSCKETINKVNNLNIICKVALFIIAILTAYDFIAGRHVFMTLFTFLFFINIFVIEYLDSMVPELEKTLKTNKRKLEVLKHI